MQRRMRNVLLVLQIAVLSLILLLAFLLGKILQHCNSTYMAVTFKELCGTERAVARLPLVSGDVNDPAIQTGVGHSVSSKVTAKSKTVNQTEKCDRA